MSRAGPPPPRVEQKRKLRGGRPRGASRVDVSERLRARLGRLETKIARGRRGRIGSLVNSLLASATWPLRPRGKAAGKAWRQLAIEGKPPGSAGETVVV